MRVGVALGKGVWVGSGTVAVGDGWGVIVALGSDVGSGVSVYADSFGGEICAGVLLGDGSGAGLQPDRVTSIAALMSSVIHTFFAPIL